MEQQKKLPGHLVIISSPSGAGKTSITNKLLELYDDLLLSVSVTTRAKRENETEGKDYFFVSEKEYEELVSEKQLLEYAEVFGNHYGTPKRFVLEKLNQDKNIVFDIDWQGARELTKHKEFNIITIFILPPSMEVLRNRLINRGLDSDEIIGMRMAQAKTEISHYSEYDYVILNDNFDEAVEKIKKIVDFHTLPSIKPQDFDSFVESHLN